MNATVKVWDPLVRMFHWSLAGLFLANFFTEDGELVHRGIGYAILALLAVRFVWGWIGTRHARFSDWVPGPRRVREYLHERLAGRSRRQLGHNPGAAVMILVLLAGVLLVGLWCAGPGRRARAGGGVRKRPLRREPDRLDDPWPQARAGARRCR